MKPKRLFYWIMFFVGIAGISGLTVWNCYQVRSVALVRNQRWVATLSETVAAQRQSISAWIGHFPVQNSTFRDIANSRSDVRAICLIDQKLSQMQRWVSPGLQGVFERIDPRLPVLQLQALEKGKTLTGPIVMAREKPYFTVVRPLDRNRVLITFLEGTRVWDLMKDEAMIWQTRVSIYDFEKHALFSSYSSVIPSASLEQTMHEVHNSRTSGFVDLPRSLAWNWLMTYHYDATQDWIFIVTEHTSWVYAPLLFFLLCLTWI